MKRRFDASRSDCHHEDREFIVVSGASLHMASGNALAADDWATTKKSTEPTVIVTEEATLYVNDVEFFVTVMLLEDSPAVLSQGLLWALVRGNGRVSTVGQRWKNCKVQV